MPISWRRCRHYSRQVGRVCIATRMFPFDCRPLMSCMTDVTKSTNRSSSKRECQTPGHDCWETGWGSLYHWPSYLGPFAQLLPTTDLIVSSLNAGIDARLCLDVSLVEIHIMRFNMVVRHNTRYICRFCRFSPGNYFTSFFYKQILGFSPLIPVYPVHTCAWIQIYSYFW